METGANIQNIDASVQILCVMLHTAKRGANWRRVEVTAVTRGAGDTATGAAVHCGKIWGRMG